MSSWESVLAAVQAALNGQPDGKALLTACWESTTPGDHAQRCVLAHYLADLEPVLDDEINWDEVALEELPGVDDADLTPVGIASAAALRPSLHLNLADGYLRRADLQAAEAQYQSGSHSLSHLGDDAYGNMIRHGFTRLRERLDAAARH